jgi:serine/threonine-protein kinase RsbW
LRLRGRILLRFLQIALGRMMVYIQLPANLEYRYLAMRATQAACSPLGQPPDVLDALASAVGEAFNNAVLHGAGPAEDPAVEIEIGLEPDAVEIRVLDYGQGFSLASVPPPDLEALDDLPEGGMGLYIIRGLMSDVAYEVGTPNVLYMRKELSKD